MTSTSDPRDPKPFSVTGYPATTSAPDYAASAYPYRPPPPHAATSYPNYNPYNPNPNGYYPNPNPDQYPNPYANQYYGSLFLRRLLAIIVAVLLAVGVITFIVWLVLRPRIPEFSVSSLAVSSFNLSSSPANSLSSNFEVNLTVTNPNSKMRASYYNVNAGVLYGNDVIAQTSLPPFEQSTGNVTVITARMVAVGEYVGDDVINGIQSDRGSGSGVVRFGVRVFMIASFRSGAWRTRNHVLRVFCDGIGVGFKNGTTGGTGSMVDPTTQCLVGL